MHVRFFKLIPNFLWKFHVNWNGIRKLQTHGSIEGLETHVGGFSNCYHFIIFNFLLMSNISITIEMYVELWVGVVKLDVQCDYRLLLPLFLLASVIFRLNYWLTFLSGYPMHMILLLKDLRCLNIALRLCRVAFSWSPELHNQVDQFSFLI